MVSAARNSLNTVEQLLILGANIWVKASNDLTALDWANLMNHKETAELIQSYSDQVICFFISDFQFRKESFFIPLPICYRAFLL